MPKLFPISIEVEELALGRVLRSLNTMAGVVRLHLNLTQEKAMKQLAHDEDGDEAPELPLPRGRVGGKMGRKSGPPAQNKVFIAIAEVLNKTPAHYKILAAAIERAGFSASGIHGYIFRLGKLKFIKRTSPGSYRLTEKGEKTFFGKNGGQNKQIGRRYYGGGPPVDNHSGVRLLVLTTLNNTDFMSVKAMNDLLEQNGFSSKNMSTTGIKMRAEGLIAFDPETSRFQITQRGQEVISNPPPKEPDFFNPDNNEEGMSTNG